MAKYTEAELMIIAFDAEDVITASGDIEIPGGDDPIDLD
jgi:hypothetical protein